jgi:hypothetical protein
MYFIPFLADGRDGTTPAEGVAVDKNGVVYGSGAGPHALKRYVKK